MSTDPIAKFKEVQRQGWKHFAPLEVMTTRPAAHLVRFAGVRPSQHVLDVACGTGVVSITASRAGATVTGLDLTPELLERARENARIGSFAVEFREGDVEALPFDDGKFDVVLSQFGHMFAPRPQVAVAEMLRVLKPGGTIAFTTWPPELLIGASFALVGRYMPPPPPGTSPPSQWGDVQVVRERLGQSINNILFDRGCMFVPALSVANYRDHIEKTAGPMLKLVEMLSASDPARLAEFRRLYDELVEPYFDDNVVRQDYLLTRAVKSS
jgi:SAM-dependent methyltransferase